MKARKLAAGNQLKIVFQNKTDSNTTVPPSLNTEAGLVKLNNIPATEAIPLL